MRKQYHRYHLCQTSPWAFYSLHYLALTLYLSAACLYASLCNIVAGILILGFIQRYRRLCTFCGGMSSAKLLFRGDHTKKVQQKLTYRLCTFLYSLKFMFFFDFFGHFFILSLSPAIQIWRYLPPSGIICARPLWELRLANTLGFSQFRCFYYIYTSIYFNCNR